MTAKIPAAIIGASGYVGGELLRLIATHPNFELAAAVSGSHAGEPVATTFPHLGSAYAATTFAAPDAWLDAVPDGAPLALFSASPHGASAAVIDKALARAEQKKLDVHVVDSSADFRYSSRDAFESVYGIEHGAPARLSEFSCAVPEHVSGTPTPHVGHPGCFATAILLAIVPLLQSGLV
ncbi:MAG: N-acetyl-gamma-glutamyl-phosphate reductase, partial [Woeseiaceae bacterium]|nr:N-acetyl-gamma-glutamyl-phosphate reductase [Woeseiaceae bacterium]